MVEPAGAALTGIFLMDPEVGERVAAVASQVGLSIQIRCVNSLTDLRAAAVETYQLLLSFGTAVIVPRKLLRRPGTLALNVHAAPPAYPGRDPHHFAAYDRVQRYGATIHFMAPRVDEGPILDVDEFTVPADAEPIQLLELARVASFRLIERTFVRIRDEGLSALVPNTALVWGEHKYSRQDFRELCRVDCSVGESEFRRRLHAVAMPGYNNLTAELFGYGFRIEGGHK